MAVPAGLLLFCPSWCVVSHLSLSSPASITSITCQSLPDRLHRLDAKTPPKHKSSFKVQGTLQLALQQTTPWASGGTGWSLHPQPWLLRLQWVPDGLGLGCLSSLPDLTRAVVSAVTPAQAQRLGRSLTTPAGLGAGHHHAGGCAWDGNVSELFFIRRVRAPGLLPGLSLVASGELRNAFAHLYSPAAKGCKMR